MSSCCKVLDDEWFECTRDWRGLMYKGYSIITPLKFETVGGTVRVCAYAPARVLNLTAILHFSIESWFCLARARHSLRYAMVTSLR